MPPRRAGARRRRLRLALAVVAAAGMTGALAMPLGALGPDDRHGQIPVAIDAINDPSFFNGAVQVDQYAPLSVYEGSGRPVAIDGRLVSMTVPGPATGNPGSVGGSDKGPDGAPLLAGTLGRLGVLPGNLQLMHPVNTRRISSPYGWRKNPTGPGHQIHIGQDYALACGSPVYAAESGRVIVAGWRGHSGNRVTIDHGSNVHTGYSHNSRLLVQVGDEVAQGQVIALVGTTGNSTGCHLHFEVLVNGRWNDPRNYLPMIPGQPNPVVDSRRLTVKSNETPGSSQGQRVAQTRPERPQPNPDTDVVTPKDDTPVVPKPSPKPAPKASPKPSPKPAASQDTKDAPAGDQPAPTPRETAGATKPPASPPHQPAPSPSPTAPSSTAPAPTKKPAPSPSPSPADETQAPSPSPDAIGSTPAPSTPSTEPTPSKTPVTESSPPPSKAPAPTPAPEESLPEPKQQEPALPKLEQQELEQPGAVTAEEPAPQSKKAALADVTDAQLSAADAEAAEEEEEDAQLPEDPDAALEPGRETTTAEP